MPLLVAQYRFDRKLNPFPKLAEVGTIPWFSLSHRGTKMCATIGCFESIAAWIRSFATSRLDVCAKAIVAQTRAKKSDNEYLIVVECIIVEMEQPLLPVDAPIGAEIAEENGVQEQNNKQSTQ